nr:hypothetical protein [Tanacetum cinerariifolium]
MHEIWWKMIVLIVVHMICEILVLDNKGLDNVEQQPLGDIFKSVSTAVRSGTARVSSVAGTTRIVIAMHEIWWKMIVLIVVHMICEILVLDNKGLDNVEQQPLGDIFKSVLTAVRSGTARVSSVAGTTRIVTANCTTMPLLLAGRSTNVCKIYCDHPWLIEKHQQSSSRSKGKWKESSKNEVLIIF